MVAQSGLNELNPRKGIDTKLRYYLPGGGRLRLNELNPRKGIDTRRGRRAYRCNLC